MKEIFEHPRETKGKRKEKKGYTATKRDREIDRCSCCCYDVLSSVPRLIVLLHSKLGCYQQFWDVN